MTRHPISRPDVSEQRFKAALDVALAFQQPQARRWEALVRNDEALQIQLALEKASDAAGKPGELDLALL